MTSLCRVTATCGLFAAAIGVLAQSAQAPPGGNGNGGPPGAETIALTGVVRDFMPDHPDFDVVPPDGYGQYMWNISTWLGGDNKPTFVGGGYKVLNQAHDATGRPICWTMYNADLGDTPAMPDGPDQGSITSADTFDTWFRDNLGLNLSCFVTVTGTLREDGEFAGMYEINIPQFYPIDGMLLGDDGPHNNFFTFEIVAKFTYDASAGYELMLLSDDDAWIFLGNQLISDLGGINGSAEQWVAMDRLNLIHDKTYYIHFFKADRSDASSRFHLVTNIPLTSVGGPTILAAFD